MNFIIILKKSHHNTVSVLLIELNQQNIVHRGFVFTTLSKGFGEFFPRGRQLYTRDTGHIAAVSLQASGHDDKINSK